METKERTERNRGRIRQVEREREKDEFSVGVAADIMYLGIYEYLYLLNSVLNAIRGEKSGEIKKRNALVKCRDG